MISTVHGRRFFSPLPPQSSTSSLKCRIARPPVAARVLAWFRSAGEGGALVEMALVMPIMFAIFTGIFTLGMYSNQKLELTEAVSVGGRLLAVERGQNNPCSLVAAAMYAAAPNLSSTTMTITFDLNGVSTGASCPGSGGAANPNLISGDNAEITATYPCNLNFYNRNMGTCTLSSSITEIVQ